MKQSCYKKGNWHSWDSDSERLLRRYGGAETVMEQNAIKERLNLAIKTRGMKQVELADKTGIDKGQISSYLSGKYKPKQENLTLLAVALDVSEYWLRGLDVEMEREDSGENVEKKRRFEVYAKQLYESREPEKVLKMYGELTEENREKVRRYMERLLAVQKMEG